jgi:hypothetical protein
MRRAPESLEGTARVKTAPIQRRGCGTRLVSECEGCGVEQSYAGMRRGSFLGRLLRVGTSSTNVSLVVLCLADADLVEPSDVCSPNIVCPG